CTKPGRCFASQVGVNAPGTENRTTLFPLNSSSVVSSFGPSLVIVLSLPGGMRSPALIAMSKSPIAPYTLQPSKNEGREDHSRPSVHDPLEPSEGLRRQPTPAWRAGSTAPRGVPGWGRP